MLEQPWFGVHPLDAGRDPAAVVRVHGYAVELADAFGADPAKMRRANGFSNATWVGDGIAVKITHTPAVVDREVALIRALPPAAGHPALLGAGAIEGHGWIVTREHVGTNLQEAWPALAPHTQRLAVERLWARVQAVHDATQSLMPLVPSHGGFIAPALDDALSAARRAGSAARLARGRQVRLETLISRYYGAAPRAEQVVNHGDLALMNALWDGNDVALLDFEFAVCGPVEIDLCRLVLEVLVSEAGDIVSSEAGDAVIDIVERTASGVGRRSLLHGAAVLDQLRDLNLAVKGQESTADITNGRPYRLLLGLLDEDGGYLAPVLQH